MSQILTSSVILREALRILMNDLVFTRGVDKQYSDQFGQTGAKKGATVNARLPPRYIGRRGQALQLEGSTENYIPITLDTQYGCDTTFSSADLTLSIDDFAKRFLKPQIAAVANAIDVDGMAQYVNINNFAGTAGQITGGSVTTAQAQAAILAGRRKLTENGAPTTERMGVLGPASEAAIIPAFTGLFNPSQTVSSFFKTGALGDNVLGFNWAADANTVSFTPMAAGSVTALSSAPAAGASTLAVTTTAGTVPRGTVLTIAGVFAINPQNRASTGSLMQFVVTQDTAVTTTGTLPIYPAYIPSGQFATCVGTPAGTAAITILSGAVGAGPYQQNLLFHPEAFTLATADLEMPEGVHFAAREQTDGISLRIVRQYDINSDMIPCRIDVLAGWKTIRPELAVRLTG